MDSKLSAGMANNNSALRTDLADIQATILNLKQRVWYISDLSSKYSIGALISTKTTTNKETKIFECSRISPSNLINPPAPDLVLKCIRRKLEKPFMEQLAQQLTQLASLQESICGSQYEHSFGDIIGFDFQFAQSANSPPYIIIRVILEKCTGTLAQFITLGQRMKCEEYLHHLREMTAALFFLESHNLSHKNLTIHNIYYKLKDPNEAASSNNHNKQKDSYNVDWKIFGFVDQLWGYSDSSQHYISPEEKYLMTKSNFSTTILPNEIDYFKVDAFNLGITFLEVLFMRELPQWGFSLDEGSEDPKTKDAYKEQAKLNALLQGITQQYLKKHSFIADVLKSMVHINANKRDRFTRIITVLHSNLNLRILCFQPQVDDEDNTSGGDSLSTQSQSKAATAVTEQTEQKKTDQLRTSLEEQQKQLFDEIQQRQHRKAQVQPPPAVLQLRKEQSAPTQPQAPAPQVPAATTVGQIPQSNNRLFPVGQPIIKKQQSLQTNNLQQSKKDDGEEEEEEEEVEDGDDNKPQKTTQDVIDILNSIYPHNQPQKPVEVPQLINLIPQKQPPQHQQQQQQQPQQQQKQQQLLPQQKQANQIAAAIVPVTAAAAVISTQQLPQTKLVTQKSQPIHATDSYEIANGNGDIQTKKHMEQIASIRKAHALELEQVQLAFEKQITVLQNAHTSQLKDIEAICRAKFTEREQQLSKNSRSMHTKRRSQPLQTSSILFDSNRWHLLYRKDKMGQEMGIMQSNIRFNTDNRLERELKLMKQQELLKQNSIDTRPKKPRTAKETFKLSQMNKFDTETESKVNLSETFSQLILSTSTPNAVNRAYLIMWMATNSTYFKYQNMFKTAIKDASDSKNSDAIFIIISSLFSNKIDQQKIFELVYQDATLRNHFLRYLQLFRPNIIKTFCDYFSLSDLESGYLLYRKAFTNPNVECQLEFARIAHKLASAHRTGEAQSIVVDSLSEQIDFMEKHNTGVLSTVHEKLEEFFEKKELFKGKDYAKSMNLSDRMVVIKRFRALLFLKQFEEADTFIEANYIAGYDEAAKQTKFYLDPELIASEFFKNKQPDFAWKYLKKIEDVVIACERLTGVGQTEVAIEHAIDFKSVQALEVIKSKTRDEETIRSIDIFISKMNSEGKPSRNPLKRLFKF